MAAAIPVWLLLLVTMALGLPTAVPVPTFKPNTPRRHCHLNGLQSVSPLELNAFKKVKDVLEEELMTEPSTCSTHPFPRAWSLRQLWMQARPVVLEAEIALILEVLGTMTNSTLRDVLDKPLDILYHIHSQLRACVLATHRPHSHRLSHRLKQLHEALRKESRGCLLASVSSQLFHLLMEDLRCVASEALCI